MRGHTYETYRQCKKDIDTDNQTDQRQFENNER